MSFSSTPTVQSILFLSAVFVQTAQKKKSRYETRGGDFEPPLSLDIQVRSDLIRVRNPIPSLNRSNLNAQ